MEKICFGTPKSNTRAYGWFQVIGSVVGIILLIFALTKFDMEDKTRDPMFGLIIATIIVLVVSTGMGIVLLKGSYNKNPCQLKAWLIYQSILVVLDVIGCAFLVFTSHAFIIILQSLLSISVKLYVMTIVNNHRKEIIASLRGNILEISPNKPCILCNYSQQSWQHLLTECSKLSYLRIKYNIIKENIDNTRTHLNIICESNPVILNSLYKWCIEIATQVSKHQTVSLR